MKLINRKLGDGIHTKHGFAFLGDFFSDQGKYILLTPGNFYEKGGFKSRPEKDRYYTGNFPNDYILRKDDLIVAMTEQGPGLLGSSALIPENDTYLHNQRLGLVDKINGTVFDKKYLYHLFNSRSVRSQIYGSATGTKVRHTSPGRIYKVKVLVPEVINQRKIALIIENYDDLIDINRRRIQLLEEAARLLFREWFVYFHFPGHEKVKIVDGMPEGWEKLQVKDIIRTVNSRKKLQKSEYEQVGLYPCVDQSQEFISGYTDRKDYVINSNLPIVVFGDHTRTIKYVDFPFVRGADGTQLLVSKNKKISSDLLYYILTNINLSNYFYARHFKFLRDQWVLVPSENLCSTFSMFSRNTMNQISILRIQNQKLAQARDLLLPRLMSGAIDPIRYDKLSNGVEV